MWRLVLGSASFWHWVRLRVVLAWNLDINPNIFVWPGQDVRNLMRQSLERIHGGLDGTKFLTSSSQRTTTDVIVIARNCLY